MNITSKNRYTTVFWARSHTLQLGNESIRDSLIDFLTHSLALDPEDLTLEESLSQEHPKCNALCSTDVSSRAIAHGARC
jgi:hypothetical protein